MNANTSFGDRLKLCLAAATGGSQAPLAKFLADRQGTSEQSGRSRVSNWIKSPGAEPLASTLALAVEFFHLYGVLVRAEWLAGGTGPMTLDSPAADVLKIHGAASRIPILGSDSLSLLRAALGDRDRIRSVITQSLNKNKGLDVFLDVSPSAFSVVVTGDAMSPALVAGDLVIIDPEVERHPGHVVLALHQEAWILRRLQGEGAGWLSAENPRYTSIPLGSVTLVGTVVQLHRSQI